MPKKTEKTCGDCEYFGGERGSGYHECDAVEHDIYAEDDDKAVVVDGSGYMAALRVRSDFGCVLWEKRRCKKNHVRKKASG